MPISEGHKNVCLIEAMDVLTFANTQTILQCANCYSVLGENFFAHVLQAKPSGIQFSPLINWNLVYTIMVLSKHSNTSSFFSFF